MFFIPCLPGPSPSQTSSLLHVSPFTSPRFFTSLLFRATIITTTQDTYSCPPFDLRNCIRYTLQHAHTVTAHYNSPDSAPCYYSSSLLLAGVPPIPCQTLVGCPALSGGPRATRSQYTQADSDGRAINCYCLSESMSSLSVFYPQV